MSTELQLFHFLQLPKVSPTLFDCSTVAILLVLFHVSFEGLAYIHLCSHLIGKMEP
jgi:hypothetical protein